MGRSLVLLAVLALAACGGGSDPAPAPNPTPTPTPTPAPNPPPAQGNVVVSGIVTFDFVPVVPGVGPGAGLDYAATVARPARRVTVEFVSGTNVIASTSTDESGNYSLTLAPSQSGFLRVKAESVRPGAPGWDFRVVDNTNGDALYALDGASFDTGTTDSVRDLHADSGWTGVAYGAPRAAAPFAILDAVYDGAELVLNADPSLVLPPLVLHWSPENRPVASTTGGPDPATGELGSSLYSAGLGGIFLLGEEDVDTDEYDRHVILHEFGHFLEAELWRSDSIGGPHTLGDRLDMRVAFGEGWGNAFSALATGDSIYRDATGQRQGRAGAFDIEGPSFLQAPNPYPGWYSEQSVQELIYDLVDTADDGADSLSLDFSAVWAAFVDNVGTTEALTSIYPFVNALRAANPGFQSSIDAIVDSQSISTGAAITDDYGSNESNNAGSADVLAIYTPITINAATPVNLCSTDEFRSSVTGMTNKLASRRFLRFEPTSAGPVTVTVTATDIPAGEFADPDLVVQESGSVWGSDGAPTAACMATAAAGWSPSDCVETTTVALGARPYTLEVYEWTNTLADDDPDNPPIGRTCFDIEVTQ